MSSIGEDLRHSVAARGVDPLCQTCGLRRVGPLVERAVQDERLSGCRTAPFMAGDGRLAEWLLKRFQHRDGLNSELGPSVECAVGPCLHRRYMISLPLGENVLERDIEMCGSRRQRREGAQG